MKRYEYPSKNFMHFWGSGKGQNMITKISSIPNKEEILQKLKRYTENDTLADNVIKQLYLKAGYKTANAMVDEALNIGIKNIEDAPKCLQELFMQVDKIPLWVNQEKLKVASEIFRRSGVAGLMILRNYCLMGGYESSAINKPLIYTGALKKGATERMAETTKFWINLTSENGLQRNQVGFKAALKTRLIHALVRVNLQSNNTWNTDEWGSPINQWDMLATNLGFSILFAQGLKDLGISINDKETNAIIHFWKYAGYLLGIKEEYLPNSEEEAICELYQWTIIQPSADKDTIALAQSLLMAPLQEKELPKWKRKIIYQVHLGYNNFFLGKLSCETMHLPKSYFRFLPLIMKPIQKAETLLTRKNKFFLDHKINSGRDSQLKVLQNLLKNTN